MAAYNEEKDILPVLKKLKKNYKNIIVVDDGSKDNTARIVEKENIILIKHKQNQGKGAAMQTGCDFAISQGADNLVLIDSDGQHLPEEIPRFLEALKKVEIVFGYREFDEKMPLKFKIGNKGLNFLTKIILGIKLKDTQSGFRSMTKEAYKKVRWISKDYSMETEMIAKTAKTNLKYTQVPISTIYLDAKKGTSYKDGFRILKNMLKWKIRK